MNNYFAKYQAHNLLKQSTELDKLNFSISSSKIDFNPHQIYAALFALKSPFSKGVLLADEVGLGKTIEASLILKQFYCSGKRNLLIICPASLRKQWQMELDEKFSLESYIIANKKDSIEPNRVNICSYHFVNNNYKKLENFKLDLCVLDEAHKLRNLHKENKIAKQLSETLKDTKKILLTATPLQNTISELYSLSYFIDTDIFGSHKSFKKLYFNGYHTEDLKQRIKPFTHRVLRSNITSIKYTNRTSNTINYIPLKNEEYLYKLVTNFLEEDNPNSISCKSKHLMNLLIRKFLGSSTTALLSTFTTIQTRLTNLLQENSLEKNIKTIAEDIAEENDYTIDIEDDTDEDTFTTIDKNAIQKELHKINLILTKAQEITVDTKTLELKKALKKGFKTAKELGGQKKCVIFTDSIKTQTYLANWLQKNTNYKIATFNGNNNDDYSKNIYKNWLEKNKNSTKVGKNKKVNIRHAIIDDFKDNSNILISTEAGAEGINLQFCSIVVNYDLPWNPQRVEQRIGRCHRYGQTHDVVVINLINTKNTAEQKIYDILKYKFKLFEGMFGASDEVLGTLLDGADFEKTVTNIFINCRSEKDISKKFKQLQLDYKEEIESNIQKAKKDLFNNFDESVITNFKGIEDELVKKLQQQQEAFWHLTKYIIPLMSPSYITYSFNDALKIFGQEPYEVANNIRLPNVNTSFAYVLTTKEDVNNYNKAIQANHSLAKIKKEPYNISTKKGQEVLEYAKTLSTPNATLQFDYSTYKKDNLPISAFESNDYQQGILQVSLEELYEYSDIFLIGINHHGVIVPKDILERLFQLSSKVKTENITITNNSILLAEYESNKNTFETKTNAEIMKLINEEENKINKWVKDKHLEAEMEKQKLEKEKTEIKKQKNNSQNPTESIKLGRALYDIDDRISTIEPKIAKKKDSIKKERDNKMNTLENFLSKKYKSSNLFTIQWEII